MKCFILFASIAIATSFPILSPKLEQTEPQQGPRQKPLTAEDFLKNQIDRGSGREERTFLIKN